MTTQKPEQKPGSRTTLAPSSASPAPISGGGRAALQLKASLRGHD